MYGWTPTIGDPTIYGWVTVVAYAVAALLCWLAHRSAPRAEQNAWLALSVLLAFLAVNKQLDLQTLMTDVGRGVAKAHGWYDMRRPFQKLFILTMGAGGLILVGVLLWLYHGASLALQGALAGMVLLFVFVLIRASSFEQMDQLINRHLAGVRANHLMELGGIAIVAACAIAQISFATSGGRPTS